MSERRLTLSLATVVVLLPLVLLLLWTFTGEWRFPDLLPSAWSWRGVEHLTAGGADVLPATLTSLLIAVSVSVAAVLVGLPAGIALGTYQWRLKGAVVLFVLLPVLVPPLASSMGVHLTFIRLGLADTALGVVLVHLVPTVPYTTLIMTGVFTQRGGEAEEAARTLGAGPWQVFWHVTLPGVLPGVSVAGLFAFLISWSQYVLTLLIGGGNVVTLPMLLFSAASGSDPVVTSALALVFALPAVLALLVAVRVLGHGDEDGHTFLSVGKVG